MENEISRDEQHNDQEMIEASKHGGKECKIEEVKAVPDEFAFPDDEAPFVGNLIPDPVDFFMSEKEIFEASQVRGVRPRIQKLKLDSVKGWELPVQPRRENPVS